MNETLVVASKVKKYLKDKHQLRVSEEVFDVLSTRIVVACDLAAGRAKATGRKTVLAKDINAEVFK